MSAYRNTRAMDVAVRLAVARLDDLVDVDSMAGRECPELVCESDVDIPVGGLGQLGHLGRLRGSQVPHSVSTSKIGTLIELKRLLVELGREVGPSR